MASDEQVLSFSVGEAAFAVPARSVREIARRPAMTRVPQGPASLVGLMNFHGAAIPVVRLSAVLGTSAKPDSPATRVVVYGEDHPVGLLVDAVRSLVVGDMATGKRLEVDQLLAEHFPPSEQRSVATKRTAAESATAAEETVSILSFRLTDQRFAFPLDSVVEVLSLPPNVTLLPRADESVVGMLDWRGSVLPLISLSQLLALERAKSETNTIVAKLGRALVGLVCGRIDGVLQVPISAIEPVPRILQRGDGDAEIDAIARVGQQKSLVSILSPTKLFQNHDVGRALNNLSAGAVEMQAQVDIAATLQFVVFSLGEDTFGLPLGAVEEIVQLPETLTRVPKVPQFIAGVMNLRGRALPVIDLRQRFQSSAATTTRPRVMVVATEQLRAGFIVDGVSEILRVNEDAVSAAPAIPGDQSRMFDRVSSTGADGAMILIVDPQELLDRAERDLLAEFKPSEGSQAPQ